MRRPIVLRAAAAWLSAAGLLLPVAPGVAAPAADRSREGRECGAFRAETNRAQNLMRAGKTQEARVILDRARTGEANSVMATFLVGLMKRKVGAPADRAEGLRLMDTATSMIAARPAWCAKERRWYALYITLGAEYYNQGDRRRAKQAFDIAYAHRADFWQISRHILLENLGRLALSEGDTDAALAYYREAQRDGMASAASVIARIKRLQAARG